MKNGGFSTYSPDGKQLAYNYVFREIRTWKRYQEGMADDIRIFDFKSKESKKITNRVRQDVFIGEMIGELSIGHAYSQNGERPTPPVLKWDYIIAINGHSLKYVKDPQELLIGLAGKTTELTVNTTPSEKGARTVLVTPLADVAKLNYYNWVQENTTSWEQLLASAPGEV